MKLFLKHFLTLVFSGSFVFAADSKPTVISKPPDIQTSSKQQAEAEKVLNDIFRFYALGDVESIKEKIDPKMVGLQKILDGISSDANQCKQLKVHFTDKQVQNGTNGEVVIETNWEKRCLRLPAMQPRLFTGHASFILNNVGNAWVISSIGGSSPLNPSLPLGR